MKQNISIIIPVLNEESTIVSFLEPLQQYRKKGHEVILVDGGSKDNTLKLSQDYIDQIISSNPGRAIQMNLGAKHAKYNIFLFLHSDTALPNSADEIILNSLTNQVQWGRFNIRLSGSKFIFRIIENMINLRSKFTKIATGDQAFFIRKKTFIEINGFPNIALMEDIALSKKLRKQYVCACLKETVITSSRRWEKYGIYRTIILMWILRLLYFIGTNPDKLYKLYYKNKNSTCCLIFTKNPELGKTKTRLIPTLGKNGAYAIHIKLLKHVLEITSKISDIDFKLYHTSNKKNKIFENLINKYKISTNIQYGENLGDRMNNAITDTLKIYSHCIIIGSDCPEMSEHYLREAMFTLESDYDAVIGPAYDGGYVLLGLRKSNSNVFSNINWGDNSVLQRTLSNLAELNIKYKKLATLHDIDTKEDLQYLQLLSNL